MQKKKRRREKVEHTRQEFYCFIIINTIIGSSEVIAMLQTLEYNYEKEIKFKKRNEIDNFLK